MKLQVINFELLGISQLDLRSVLSEITKRVSVQSSKATIMNLNMLLRTDLLWLRDEWGVEEKSKKSEITSAILESVNCEKEISIAVVLLQKVKREKAEHD